MDPRNECEDDGGGCDDDGGGLGMTGVVEYLGEVLGTGMRVLGMHCCPFQKSGMSFR